MLHPKGVQAIGFYIKAFITEIIKEILFRLIIVRIKIYI